MKRKINLSSTGKSSLFCQRSNNCKDYIIAQTAELTDPRRPRHGNDYNEMILKFCHWDHRKRATRTRILLSTIEDGMSPLRNSTSITTRFKQNGNSINKILDNITKSIKILATHQSLLIHYDMNDIPRGHYQQEHITETAQVILFPLVKKLLTYYSPTGLGSHLTLSPSPSTSASPSPTNTSTQT